MKSCKELKQIFAKMRKRFAKKNHFKNGSISKKLDAPELENLLRNSKKLYKRHKFKIKTQSNNNEALFDI